jgi:hypothetical protein
LEAAIDLDNHQVWQTVAQSNDAQMRQWQIWE